jgi:hypothetical protein
MAKKQDERVVAAAIAGGDAEYMAKLAEGYYYGRGRDKSLKLALQLWEKAAELDNADALYYSAVCYYYGDGVTRNKETAFSLWERSAALGHTGAQMSLADLRGSSERGSNEEGKEENAAEAESEN